MCQKRPICVKRDLYVFTELGGNYLEQRQKEHAAKLAEEEAALRTSIEATHDTALKSLHRDIAREQGKLSLQQREAQTSAASKGHVTEQNSSTT
jgi:hypothetical protein